MQELYLKDVGGVEPEATDILSDEIVTYLDGINTALGTNVDPRFGEYQEFLNSINEASILRIEPEQMSSGKYDGLDLTGEEEDVVIKDVPDSTFCGKMTMTDLIKTLYFTTPYTIDSGIKFDKNYTRYTQSQMILPKYTNA